ncbi:MAG: dephospho-CoA kinase [Neisseriaceae bacterium]|nr:dephospho-CoA kinase [Neisseriaceae bacterium]
MTHWIALTGGIGSGKSTVAELFFDRHRITTIDSDIVARKLTAANGQAIPLIRQAFGDDFIDISGSLNRQAMRHLITQDKTAKARLEQLLHPMIFAEIKRQQAAVKALYAFVAIPLLVEEPQFMALAERVLLVDCDEDLQIERVKQRNQMTQAQAAAALRLQVTREKRQAIADDTIHNSGSLNDLIQQVDNMHDYYCKLFQAA